MREAIGSSQILLIIVVLIVVIMMFLAGSIGYTKAFKARNSIVNIVQTHGRYGKSAEAVLEEARDEIGNILNEMGYKTNIGSKLDCTDRNSDEKYGVYEVAHDRDYSFCIYRFVDKQGNQLYGVETYMYFELPVFGRNDRFAFPIYGDTYTFFQYGPRE